VTLVRSCIHEIWRCMISSRRRILAFKLHILHTWLTCINYILPLFHKVYPHLCVVACVGNDPE
jgi:hypothetical protein